MTQTNFNFTTPDSIKGITEADYQQIIPCVETVRSLAQTTYQSIYIIDLYKKNFLYVSDNPILLCGQTAETMLKMGYDFFKTHVPEEEHPMLDGINQAAYKVFYNVPAEHRRQCMISFDFHILHKNNQILVNHKSTPMALTKDGTIWLVMSVVSISSHKKAGHIEFYQFHSRERFEYSLENNSWNKCETITLRPEEQQVLTLSAQGYTMKEISELMLRSFDTIKFYRHQTLKKLGAQSITEALTFAANYGLI